MFKSSSLCFNSSNLGTFWLKIEQFWPFEEISNLNCISIMMSFLTYIMGFFYELWTFVDFDRLCKLGINKHLFWKRTTQESFQQSLVEIGSVVSEEKIFF
jgi:hypothetical protein